MPLIIKLVPGRHFICREKCNKTLHPLIKKFWKSRHLNSTESDLAVIAIDNDQIVGFVRFMIGKYRWYYSVGGLGTYILPQYRKKGLASKMWFKILDLEKPGFVVVTLTSRNAKRLFQSLETKYKTIKFYTKKEYK